VGQVIRKVLSGSGECHQVNWTFLSLAMPTWVLLVAGALGALGIYANFRGESPRVWGRRAA
jgi:disulfide bond formation protein DsbB